MRIAHATMTVIHQVHPRHLGDAIVASPLVGTMGMAKAPRWGGRPGLLCLCMPRWMVLQDVILVRTSMAVIHQVHPKHPGDAIVANPLVGTMGMAKAPRWGGRPGMLHLRMPRWMVLRDAILAYVAT